MRQVQTRCSLQNAKRGEETRKEAREKKLVCRKGGAGYRACCFGMLNAVQNTVFPQLKKTSDLSFACVQRGRLALNVYESCKTVSIFGWGEKVTLFCCSSFYLAVSRYTIIE